MEGRRVFWAVAHLEALILCKRFVVITTPVVKEHDGLEKKNGTE